MTTLEFKDRLTENTFSFGNDYIYNDDKEEFGLFFERNSSNYPFILKGGVSDPVELEYSTYHYQLRGRLLNTKKIKEVMDSSRLPLAFTIKRKRYLIGKGFLSEYDPRIEINKVLFIACVDGTKSSHTIEQVKFFVCKDIYNEEHKVIQPAIKDFVGSHPGDVIICKNILDYVGEKLTLPRGVPLTEMNNHKKAVVRTAIMGAINWTGEKPFVLDATYAGNTARVEIYNGDTGVTPDPLDLW